MIAIGSDGSAISYSESHEDEFYGLGERMYWLHSILR